MTGASERSGKKGLAPRKADVPVRQGTRARGVALTGVNTVLGRGLLGLLEDDERVGRVVLLDLKAPRRLAAKSRFYEVDLTAPGVDSHIAEILHAEQVDDLAHLAVLSGPTQATAWAHELESVGTMHLLDACRRRPPSRFVLASSTLVYGPHPSNPNFLTEEHRARGLSGARFVADKIDVEEQVQRFAERSPRSAVTVLRLAPMLGPETDSYLTRWLSRPVVATAMGFDPLLQFVHEIDAVAAVRHALDRGVPGVFNVAGEGVLPVSSVLRLLGRVAVPFPYRLLRTAASLSWVAQLGDAPAAMVSALRYLCVVDTTRAEEVLGFRPRYAGRDALLDFEAARRLRQARPMKEVA